MVDRRAHGQAVPHLRLKRACPSTYAVAQASALPDDYYAAVADDLRVKRDFFCDGLAKAGFEAYRPAGTYFVTTDVRPLGYTDGMRFCRELPDRGRAGGHPEPGVLRQPRRGAGRQVRFAFCKKQEVLAEALARLARLGGD